MSDRPFSLRSGLRRAIVGQVQAMFNDVDRGERPVVRSEAALFPAGSPIWQVHGDVVAMMIGGVAALLLQMLHPAVLAGVWDHSRFRNDMAGRLRRTARFIAVTTYGDRAAAEAAIAEVRNVHSRISGLLPDNRPYRADDPALLAWVHVCEAWCFMAAWQRYGSRRLPAVEEDRYFSQFATIALALGADPVPHTRFMAERQLTARRCELTVDHRTREVARFVLDQRTSSLAIPLQRLMMQAAVDLLPGWARRMHRLPASPLPVRPLVDSGALGIAASLRWAFGAD